MMDTIDNIKKRLIGLDESLNSISNDIREHSTNKDFASHYRDILRTQRLLLLKLANDILDIESRL